MSTSLQALQNRRINGVNTLPLSAKSSPIPLQTIPLAMQVHTASSIPIFFVPSTVCLRKPSVRQHIVDRTRLELVRNNFTNEGASRVEVV